MDDVRHALLPRAVTDKTRVAPGQSQKQARPQATSHDVCFGERTPSFPSLFPRPTSSGPL